MNTALFGFRDVAEAVELDVREVVGMVRSGHGDRLAGMVFGRQSNPADREGWEAFIRSAEEITLDVDWDEFLRSIDEITDRRRGSSAASISQGFSVPHLCRNRHQMT